MKPSNESSDVLHLQGSAALECSTLLLLTSTENVNKLCLFVQETEHLQVKLTMMVCPERMSNVYNFSSF